MYVINFGRQIYPAIIIKLVFALSLDELSKVRYISKKNPKFSIDLLRFSVSPFKRKQKSISRDSPFNYRDAQ
jgi:hypothetical protein